MALRSHPRHPLRRSRRLPRARARRALDAREEAEAAADIASSSRGVERVVKVFEYLD